MGTFVCISSLLTADREFLAQWTAENRVEAGMYEAFERYYINERIKRMNRLMKRFLGNYGIVFCNFTCVFASLDGARLIASEEVAG